MHRTKSLSHFQFSLEFSNGHKFFCVSTCGCLCAKGWNKRQLEAYNIINFCLITLNKEDLIYIGGMIEDHYISTLRLTFNLLLYFFKISFGNAVACQWYNLILENTFLLNFNLTFKMNYFFTELKIFIFYFFWLTFGVIYSQIISKIFKILNYFLDFAQSKKLNNNVIIVCHGHIPMCLNIYMMSLWKNFV